MVRGNELLSVKIAEEVGDSLQVSPPEVLFKVRLPPGLIASDAPLAVSRDGSRIFLLLQPLEQAAQDVINVSTAWDQDLNR